MSAPGRVVLVTGAAGNLGRAVAAAFAASGDRLALMDRDAGRLQAAFGAEDAGTRHLPCDLRDAAAVATAIEALAARWGPVDVLCHVAGGFDMGPAVHETSDLFFDGLFDLNARSLLHLSRAVVPGMRARGRGRIVTVGAASAQRGLGQMGAYTAAKSALLRLTEAMSDELRDAGIGVNAVLPSVLDTPENRAAMPDADPSRWVAPADVAAVMHFLASDAARAVHGAAVPVRGLG